MYNFNFNCIVILQSLGDGDRKTGDEIRAIINTALISKGQDQYAQLYNLQSKTDLILMLLSMKKQAKEEGLKPFIHFEIHGSEQGFDMVNGDKVYWTDIKELVREINIATGNNLFVSLATCYGAYFLRMYDYCDPCPFFGYIGMNEQAGELDLEFSYTTFFQTVLSGADIVEGIKAMKREVPSIADKLSYINCFQFYSWMLKENAKMMGDDTAKRNWINKLFVEVKTHYPQLNSEKVYEFISQRINEGAYDNHFANCQKVFLHNQLERFTSK